MACIFLFLLMLTFDDAWCCLEPFCGCPLIENNNVLSDGISHEDVLVLLFCLLWFLFFFAFLVMLHVWFFYSTFMMIVMHGVDGNDDDYSHGDDVFRVLWCMCFVTLIACITFHIWHKTFLNNWGLPSNREMNELELSQRYTNNNIYKYRYKQRFKR